MALVTLAEPLLFLLCLMQSLREGLKLDPLEKPGIANSVLYTVVIRYYIIIYSSYLETMLVRMQSVHSDERAWTSNA